MKPILHDEAGASVQNASVPEAHEPKKIAYSNVNDVKRRVQVKMNGQV
jgi:hypothetical protein